jgi:Cytidylate kinase-like family
MAIITISRGSYSKGEEVAAKVAQRLGYRSICREVILEAAQIFQVPQNKLDRAMHAAPSILERFFSEKQKYIAYVTAVALSQFKSDNVVYHGSGGHFFANRISPMAVKILAYFKKENVIYDGFAEEYYARTISHLLKVRISAKLDDRIRLRTKKENLNREQAVKLLKKEDRERNAWSRHFYGVDDTDPSLYDLVIHINKLKVDDAVDLICETAAKPLFKTSTESQQAIEDLALASGIKAALFNDYPGCEVVAEKRSVEIYVRFTLHTDTMISDRIREKVLQVPGVSSVSVILIPSVLYT